MTPLLGLFLNNDVELYDESIKRIAPLEKPITIPVVSAPNELTGYKKDIDD